MADRNDLSALNLAEFSICFEDLGGPANEDCTIEFVKSKSGLAPVLKETDMSDHNDQNDGEHDEDFAAFAEEHGDAILEEFDGYSAEDQANALVGLAYENAVQEAAIEDATEVVKSLTENTVSKEKYEELKKSAAGAVAIIEKMKASGAKVEDDDTLSRITKSLGGEANIPDDVRATLSDLVKAKDEAAIEKAQTRAKTYGFGDFKVVADLETKIRKAFGDKDAEAFVGIVKQAGGLVKGHPLMKSIGEDAGGADANTPIAKAKAGAAEIRKANAGMSEAQAMTQYWREHPDEYVAMRQGQAAA